LYQRVPGGLDEIGVLVFVGREEEERGVTEFEALARGFHDAAFP
jgi:hypothetical protein